MKKIIQTLTLVAVVVLLSSFAKKDTGLFIGTFGVSASDPAQVKLIINSDHTFFYQDFSGSDQIMEFRGSWALKGNRLILNDPDTNVKFHTVWTVENDGQAVRSRKGLNFYRLRRISQ